MFWQKKKPLLGIIFLLTLVAVGTILVGYRTERSLSMEYPAELAQALDVMNSLQSRVLIEGDQGAQSHAEILDLGQRVLVIESAFSHNDDRISVLGIDRDHFREVVRRHLLEIIPGEISIDPALVLLGKPDAFINAYTDYKSQLPAILANALNVEEGVVSALPESFYRAAFEVTKDTREIIARMRGNDWLNNYKQDLCIKTEGGVDMITFDQDSDGKISYDVTKTHPDMCIVADPIPGQGDTADYFATKYSCEDNQLGSVKNIPCPYGCDQGTCSEPPAPVVELSHFELCKANEKVRIVDGFGGSEGGKRYMFDLGVIAKNSDGSIATDHDNHILLIVTGDNDAQYPEATDLKLSEGKGYQFFPVSLTRTESTFGQPVVLSAKDSTAYINGSEAYGDLKECPEFEAGDACLAIYDPVCGMSGGQPMCDQGSVCPTIVETFSNHCELDKDPVYQFLHEGECDCDSEDFLCLNQKKSSPGDDDYEVTCSAETIEINTIQHCALSLDAGCEAQQKAEVQWTVDTVDERYTYDWVQYDFQDDPEIFEDVESETLIGKGIQHTEQYTTEGKKTIVVRAMDASGNIVSRGICESESLTKDFAYSSCESGQMCVEGQQYVLECEPEPAFFVIPGKCDTSE